MSDEYADRDVNHIPTIIVVDDEGNIKKVISDTSGRLKTIVSEGHNYVWDTTELEWVRMQQPVLEADSVTAVIEFVTAAISNTPSIQSILDTINANVNIENVSASIVNTPSIQNIIDTINVSVANTSTVNIGNSPTVNIAGTPEVVISNVVSTNIGNTPSIQAIVDNVSVNKHGVYVDTGSISVINTPSIQSILDNITINTANINVINTPSVQGIIDALPEGTNTIGKVEALINTELPTGTNTIGNVGAEAVITNTPSIQTILDNVTINPVTVTVGASALPSGAATEVTLAKTVGLNIGEFDKAIQTTDSTHDYWTFVLDGTTTNTVSITYTDATKQAIDTVELL